ncbi:uncharacterized protein LOC133816326 [Humulus lupulus]|uniref:uncharacterized protein LOC133816326 n=1 Tax=Humulus lupulus TaxID=3486 RepID=UPI002B410353|nr:uncharacterized protein LOC133816326 [Humulus lupulus]
MSCSYSTVSLPFFLSTRQILKYSSSPKRFNANNKAIQSNIRAQSYRDHHHHHEGPSSRSSNHIVDANLSILEVRIEEIKLKEKLERCCRSDHYGWNNYTVPATTRKSNYRKRGQPAALRQLLELATIVGGTLGFTIFTGTLFLCLVSLSLHMNQISL